MLEDLLKVRNTLNLIETKGQSTIVIAETMNYLDQMIMKARIMADTKAQPVEGE